MRSGVRGEAPPAGLVPGVNRAGVFHSGRQPSAHQANCPRGQPLGQVSFLGRWRVLGVNRSGKFCRPTPRLPQSVNRQPRSYCPRARPARQLRGQLQLPFAKRQSLGQTPERQLLGRSDAHRRCRKHGTGCACPQRQPLGQALSLRQTPDARRLTCPGVNRS